ncbi:Structural maintenance of chromosomes protein 6 [Cryptotrichosporon argae]
MFRIRKTEQSRQPRVRLSFDITNYLLISTHSATAMANQSRRRRDEDSDEDDTDDVSPLKRFKLEQRRRRVEADGASESDRSRAYDSESDVDLDWDTDGLDGDQLNLDAYRSVLARSKKLGSRFAEAGILKAVTLQNFMCHSHLSVDFQPSLNFIVGHNGSGKSAILTAIAVALGGTVNQTGRGNGLKDLIKNECDKAAVILTLANRGVDAFRPDVYDEGVIIIERHMDRNGTSGYKFRAKRDGKIVATKRDELNAILSRFSLNADSPLTILTQDVAKSFLTSHDAHDYYKFFLRGTTLSDLTKQYEKVYGNIEIVRNSMTAAKESKPDVEARLSQLRRDLQAARAIGDQIAQKEALEREQAWSYVVQKEKLARLTSDKIAKAEEKVQSSQAELDKVLEERGRLAHDEKTLKDGLTRFEQRKQPLTTRRTVVIKDISATKTALSERRAAISEIDGDIQARKDEIAKLDRTIQDRAGENVRQREYEEKREHLEALKKLRDQLQRSGDKNTQSLRTAQDELQKNDGERGDLEDAKDMTANFAAESVRRLRMFQHQQTNQLFKFGQKIDIVMRMIDQERWIHSKPLGPLGNYVKLQDMRYANVITSHIGSTMCSFAVRDGRDRVKLMKILQEAFRQPGNGQNGIPSIVQHSGDIFDYRAGDLSDIGETVLSKLVFSDEQVLRIFINSNNIESTMLAPDKMKADLEIKRILTARQDLRVVRVISAERWAQSGTRVGAKVDKNSGPMPSWTGNVLFVRDVSEEAARLNDVIADAERKRDDAEAAYQAWEDKRKQGLDAVNKLKGDVDRSKKGYADITRKISSLSMEVEAIKPATDDALEGQREDLQTELRGFEAEHDSMREDLQALTTKLEELEKEKGEIDDELRDFAPEAQRQNAGLQALAGRIGENVRSQKQWEEKRDKYERLLEQAREEGDDIAASIKELIRKATEMCGERVETDREPQVIRKQRQAVEKAIAEAAAREPIDINVVTHSFNQVEQQLRDLETSIKDLDDLVKLMDASLDRRKDGWERLRQTISIRARTAFIHNLLKRSFDGRLRFDHQLETLEVQVEPAANRAHAEAETGKKGGKKTTKNLSGGERSFSTVSFLLALWDATPSSVRCLDEWDVFLDMSNRLIAANMLMEGAADCDGKQFILITPQDMNNIRVPQGCGVIKLQDPLRNQTTLDFAPA